MRALVTKVISVEVEITSVKGSSLYQNKNNADDTG